MRRHYYNPRPCDHRTVMWIPIDTVQGPALACQCMRCKKVVDIMHRDEPVYLREPLEYDEPEDYHWDMD